MIKTTFVSPPFEGSPDTILLYLKTVRSLYFLKDLLSCRVRAIRYSNVLGVCTNIDYQILDIRTVTVTATKLSSSAESSLHLKVQKDNNDEWRLSPASRGLEAS